MARDRWTADTIPRVPPVSDVLPMEARRPMFVARHEAMDALRAAEQAEAAARSLRAAANQKCEHYKTLLEEAATEPLFEVEGS